VQAPQSERRKPRVPIALRSRSELDIAPLLGESQTQRVYCEGSWGEFALAAQVSRMIENPGALKVISTEKFATSRCALRILTCSPASLSTT
jgi:hypothetical protein